MRPSVGARCVAGVTAVLASLVLGCASIPQYVAPAIVVPAERLALSSPPIVKARAADAAEADALLKYPGKAERDAARIADAAGASAIVFGLWPFFLPFMVESMAQANREQEAHALAEARNHAAKTIPSQLREKIEQQLVALPPDANAVLEVVVLTDMEPVPSSGRELKCWFIHARVTLQLAGVTRYEDVIRIDPFARSADAPVPECTGPAGVLAYLDAIAAMLVTRLPGLPWKVATIPAAAATEAPPAESSPSVRILGNVFTNVPVSAAASSGFAVIDDEARLVIALRKKNELSGAFEPLFLRYTEFNPYRVDGDVLGNRSFGPLDDASRKVTRFELESGQYQIHLAKDVTQFGVNRKFTSLEEDVQLQAAHQYKAEQLNPFASLFRARPTSELRLRDETTGEVMFGYR